LPALALALIAVPGWAGTEPADPIFRGEYFYNFENAVLTPDGKDEAWCIDGDMSKAASGSRSCSLITFELT
jgi:hypothetical protein